MERADKQLYVWAGASMLANQLLPSHVLPHSVCLRLLSLVKKFMSFSCLANVAICSGWRSWNKSPVKQKTHQEVGYRSMFAHGPHRLTTLLELAGWCWREPNSG